MSSFFDDASLVMIPSGYKDGKVYSVKPTSGAGDLTFTRNSNATRVDANGLVEKVRTNSLLQSNQFDTTWTTTNSTLTSGQSGYDGSSDAWLLDKSGTQGRVTQSITQSDLQTLSIYAKKGTSEYLRMFVNGPNSSIYFNLNDGTIQSSSAIVSGKSTNLGGGWYRCEVAFTGSTTLVNYYPAEAGSTAGTSGNIYIQDAQLEQGLVATDYIETTTTAMSEFAGVTASSVADVPRLDYSGGATCPSLLLEPQRTNLIDNAEYLNGWSLQSGVVVSNNETTSPEGVQNAGIATAAFSNSRIQRNLGTLGSNYIFSAFVKSDGVGTRMELRSNVTGDNLILDVAASGEVTHFSDTAVGNNYDIESYGNGWYRVWFEGTTDGASSNYYQIYPDVQSGNRSVYVWGIQMEAGSYPTSYIPSYGTTVTRLADSCSKTGISSLIGQTEGTIFVEFISGADDATNHILSLSDGTTSNRVSLVKNTSDDLRAFVASGGASQASILWPNYAPNTNIKAAISYKANEIQFYANGESAGTDTSALVPASLTQVEFETSGSPFAYPIKQLLVFPTALTATQMAELTA